MYLKKIFKVTLSNNSVNTCNDENKLKHPGENLAFGAQELTCNLFSVYVDLLVFHLGLVASAKMRR